MLLWLKLGKNPKVLEGYSQTYWIVSGSNTHKSRVKSRFFSSKLWDYIKMGLLLSSSIEPLFIKFLSFQLKNRYRHMYSCKMDWSNVNHVKNFSSEILKKSYRFVLSCNFLWLQRSHLTDFTEMLVKTTKYS